jgi:DNA-binding transcriptional MocR family regulator
MTNWIPELDPAQPRYLAIADALAADIVAGRLKPGDRLPTHRDLAWNLKVTVGTVSRAYREAERRGLILGEVGRGSFVAPPAQSPPRYRNRPNERPGFVNLSANVATSGPIVTDAAAAFAELGQDTILTRLMDYQPIFGDAEQLETAAEWVQSHGLAVKPSELALTNGAQHAAMLAMSALARSGDAVLCEPLTFYGMKALARMLELKLHGVEMDGEGIRPEALDAACRATGARLLYTVPTLQNPTAAVMSDTRRAEIAEVCRRHEVWVVEDDIYTFLLPPTLAERPAPIAQHLPELTLYTNSVSKVGLPGLRVGYLRFPEKLRGLIDNSVRASGVSPNGVSHEIARRLIESGAIRRAEDWQREEIAARQATTRAILDGHRIQTHPNSMHLWLHLPQVWTAERFALAAERAGVGVLPASTISCDRSPGVEAVRLSLGCPATRSDLETALFRLRDLAMQEDPALELAAL